MNLNQIMDAKKISGYRLSKVTGVSQASISDYRKGASEPTISIAKKLAKGLGVSVAELIEDEPGPDAA